VAQRNQEKEQEKEMVEVSMSKLLIGFLVRHGETDLNANNAYRGWSDVPLNEQGKNEAIKIAKFLKNYQIKDIISSPLLRAFATASKIADEFNLEVIQQRGLLPLNVGVFSSLSRKDNEKAFHLFINNPNVTIPNGESLDDFETRQFVFFQYFLKKARETSRLVVFVTHTSNSVALNNFLEGAESIEPEVGEAVKPGGILGIYWDGKNHSVEILLGKPDVAKFGGS
jgi:probable phosphoglycerate mutase